MKSKTVIWVWLIAALLWIIVGLRDIFAPRFFTMSPRVMTKLDIAMEFVAAAAFLIVAALFHRSMPKVDVIENQ
jgi:hypothetical protein